MKNLIILFCFTLSSFSLVGQGFEVQAVLDDVGNMLVIQAKNITAIPIMPASGNNIGTLSFQLNDNEKILSLVSSNYLLGVPNAGKFVFNSGTIVSPEDWPIDEWKEVVKYNVQPGSDITDFVITEDVDGDGSDDEDPVLSVFAAGGFNQIMQVQSTILPIILKSFTATKYKETSAILNWISASEVNSSHFEVERSINTLDWTHIRDVKAAGNSYKELSYKLVDNDLPLNKRSTETVFYYRLKMVDLDGAYEYSDVEAVRFDALKTSRLEIFPNPTANDVYVTLDNVGEQGVLLSVIDKAGRLVLSQKLTQGDEERVSLANLPAGIYYITVDQDGERYTQKVIKMD